MEHLLKYGAIACVFIATLIVAHWLMNLFVRKDSGESLLESLKQRFDPGRTNSLAGSFGQVDLVRLKRFQKIGIVTGFFFGLVLMDLNLTSVTTYIFAVATACIGFYVPPVIMKVMDKKRQSDMGSQLPDALELIVNSLKAGLSLLQALEVVSKESPQPICEEFAAVCRDCRLGLTPEEAMEKMLIRWPHQDLELFIIASGVSIRTGGNLAEVAGRLIQTIRERFRLQGRIASLTAQGKLSGWVVGLLPVGLCAALMALEPEMMGDFIKHPMGITLLLGAVVLELLGAFFISKIVTIDTRG